MPKLGIVTQPTVTVVASSRMSVPGLQEFIRLEELDALLEKETAPITRILEAVIANRNADSIEGVEPGKYTDAELLPELAGRFCYRSWSKGRETPEYHENILEEAHGNILEHTYVSLAITGVSRTLTHELIRHRAGATPSQESQRYVDANHIRFVMPPIQLHYYGVDSGESQEWHAAQVRTVEEYEKWQELLRFEIDNDDDLPDALAKSTQKKRANEAARANLAQCVETKLVWTANLRAFRHQILSRGADPADLEIRRLFVEITEQLKVLAPTVFDDIEIVPPGPADFGVPTIRGKHWKV